MRARIRSPRRARGRARIALVALLGAVVMASAACTTPTSQIRVPPCVDQITVSGQHARGSNTTLILDHTYDLPFTQTKITLEERDGKTRDFVVTNSVPDLWRLFGAGLLGVTGGVLLSRYSIALSEGEGDIDGSWFWALPVGVLTSGLAVGMVATGWHPPGDTVIDYECPAP